MDIFETQIMDMVFQQTRNWTFDEVIFDGPMLLVLSKMDGIRTLGEIKRDLDLGTDEVKAAVNRLAELHLIQPASNFLVQATAAMREKTAASGAGDSRGMVFRGIKYG